MRQCFLSSTTLTLIKLITSCRFYQPQMSTKEEALNTRVFEGRGSEECMFWSAGTILTATICNNKRVWVYSLLCFPKLPANISEQHLLYILIYRPYSNPFETLYGCNMKTNNVNILHVWSLYYSFYSPHFNYCAL